ncbi:MAG: hypothetical protein NC930_06625 [Candidatus Omnitrophica bacterium]|nr:hypothetical protein [Candidatus Omnitrophota bacterium]
MRNTRFIALTGIILVAALSRLVPHPPNVTPITAMALFGGVYFSDKRLAFLIPFIAMLLSDLVLGLHSLLAIVYLSFGLIVCIGMWLRSRRTAPRIVFAAFLSSVLFFILTNFGVWILTSMYPRTLEGFISCYTAAIPFFRNTLLADLAYTSVLFGGWSLLEAWLPALRENAFAEAGNL